MKKLALGGLALSLVLTATPRVLADGNPVVDVTSIWIWPYQSNNESDMKWVPRANFNFTGPVDDGSVFWISYSTGGKPWAISECNHEWSGPVGTAKCELVGEDKVAPVTGPVSFQIGMKNELHGQNLNLFSGVFKAGRHHVGNNHPNFKKNFGYYVDYDWALPISYLYLMTKDEEYAPYLRFSTWFRIRYEPGNKYQAFIFSNGKQLCQNETGDGSPSYETKSPFKPSIFGWERVNFYMTDCRFLVQQPPENISYPSATMINKNPGEYELKVLRNGKLSRVAKFTITADGQIQDVDGTAALHTTWKVIPVKIVDEQDGKWNKAAWAKEAFYGHPLSGFQAPSGK